MINISLNINDRDINNIKHLPTQFKRGLRRGIGLAAKYLEGAIKRQFGHDNSPKVITGNLRRSVISGQKNGFSAYVNVNAVYADILDSGGVIHGKPWLAFKINDKFIKVKKVVIPPKPYIEPALRKSEEALGKIITNNIIEEMEKN